MQIYNYLKRKAPLATLLGLLISLVSCGSYEYVGVDNDGIYGGPVVQNQGRAVEVPKETESNYYENYFQTKAIESENLDGDNTIFTDIDEYENSSYVENDTIPNNYEGYGGWGQNSSNVTINYIDNP